MSAEDETAKMATEKFVEEYDNEHKIQPYSGTPKKDGVASAGDASTGFACGDHVHPTDTTRVAVGTFNTEIGNLLDLVNGKVDALEQGVRGNIVAFGNGSNKLEDTGKTVNDFFDNVAYDENSKKILFKNGDTVLKELSATQFIKDGMVSSVYISDGKLVISFNTDAGKEDIQIPLADIFNPQNYYDKTAADGRFVQKVSGKDIVAVDSALSDSSTNPVQNKVVTEELVEKLSRVEAEAGFTEWKFNKPGSYRVIETEQQVVLPGDKRWEYVLRDATNVYLDSRYEDDRQTSIDWSSSVSGLISTRTRLPTMADIPTKTSELTNDSGFLTEHQSLAGLTPMYPFSAPTMTQTGDWTFEGTSAGDGYHWEPVYVVGNLWSLYKVSDRDPSDRTDMGDDVTDDDSAVVIEFLNTGVTATRGYVCTLTPFTNAQIEMGKWTFTGTPAGNGYYYIVEPFDSVESKWTLDKCDANNDGATVKSESIIGTADDLVLLFDVMGVTATRPPSAFEIAVGALPTGVTGKVRDCELVIDCTADGAVAPTVTWGTHFHPRTDTATDLAIVKAGKRAVFYISEYASGEFAVGGWVETEGGSGT